MVACWGDRTWSHKAGDEWNLIQWKSEREIIQEPARGWGKEQRNEGWGWVAGETYEPGSIDCDDQGVVEGGEDIEEEWAGGEFCSEDEDAILDSSHAGELSALKMLAKELWRSLFLIDELTGKFPESFLTQKQKLLLSEETMKAEDPEDFRFVFFKETQDKIEGEGLNACKEVLFNLETKFLPQINEKVQDLQDTLREHSTEVAQYRDLLVQYEKDFIKYREAKEAAQQEELRKVRSKDNPGEAEAAAQGDTSPPALPEAPAKPSPLVVAPELQEKSPFLVLQVLLQCRLALFKQIQNALDSRRNPPVIAGAPAWLRRFCSQPTAETDVDPSDLEKKERTDDFVEEVAESFKKGLEGLASLPLTVIHPRHPLVLRPVIEAGVFLKASGLPVRGRKALEDAVARLDFCTSLETLLVSKYIASPQQQQGAQQAQGGDAVPLIQIAPLEGEVESREGALLEETLRSLLSQWEKMTTADAASFQLPEDGLLVRISRQEEEEGEEGEKEKEQRDTPTEAKKDAKKGKTPSPEPVKQSGEGSEAEEGKPKLQRKKGRRKTWPFIILPTEH
uniref:Uncharacterized protein n=1 Tax=Chromera velia CCMP2878 TaxID=1169474 RepID=A0A0G4FTZ9_9ALVE|eukprot:Cvel_18656.t1-p1 / transcript=Cvel_18656.t1 / gene=Cvel_18656 / organism=Chromera_velia_CCMP2878 / gene_product=hypothetical protein / transcript_product=hypothetical protein / location=Cvel_scaffold1559:8488-14243(-) / protein_length=563 / sequence_SO=supercontig / SO=protein_coding / is_pseudo=false